MNGQFDRGFINSYRKKPAIIFDSCKKTKNNPCKCDPNTTGICGLKCKPKTTLIEYSTPI